MHSNFSKLIHSREMENVKVESYLSDK